MATGPAPDPDLHRRRSSDRLGSCWALALISGSCTWRRRLRIPSPIREPGAQAPGTRNLAPGTWTLPLG